MTKISIIVPIYNAEKYLTECIRSIIGQTYQDWELILVDDGSTDSSATICWDFSLHDPRIHCIHKENGGVSFARNEGIKMTSGESIIFVDSDDFIEPNMIELLINNPEADFSMCGYQLYDEAIQIVTKQYVCESLEGNIQDLAKNIRNYLSPPFLLGPCFKMFRRSIIERYNIKFPLNLSYGEDAVFVFEYLMYCKKVNIISDIGYNYRKHGAETLSGYFRQDKIDINYRINCLIGSFLQQQGIDDREVVLEDRMLECFVSYTKELVCSTLNRREKRTIFYDKYCLFGEKLGKPNRLAQRIVLLAGKHKLIYFLVYLFRIKR